MQVDGAVRGAGDEAKESGTELGGEEEKEDDVGPGVWHLPRAFRLVWSLGKRILAWGVLFGYEGGRGLVLWGEG